MTTVDVMAFMERFIAGELKKADIGASVMCFGEFMKSCYRHHGNVIPMVAPDGKASELTNIMEVCESGKMDFHKQSTTDADVAVLASFGDVQTPIRIRRIRELNFSVSAFGQTHEITLSNRRPGDDPFGPFFS